MEVREGYKESEVGVIPEDWEVIKLDKVGQFKKGKGIAKKELTKEGFPCVLYGEIYTKYDFTAERLHSFTSYESSEKSTKINTGDILFTGSGETVEDIGKSFAYLGDKTAYAGGDIILMTPYLEYDPAFIGYLTNSRLINEQKSKLAQGSSVIHIYSSGISKIIIPVPSLKEQKSIVKALTDTDSLIHSIEKLIDKKEKIKDGTMQQLLTGKRRLDGFSGKWEVKSLRNITNLITCGIASTPTYVDLTIGVPFLSSTNVKNGEIRWDNFKYISKNLHNKLYKNNPPLKGDILYSRVGTIGEAALVETDKQFSIYVSLTLIKTNDMVHNKYLVHLLNSSKYKRLAQNTVLLGGGVGNLNVDVVRKFEVIIPSINEQKAISKILSDMDLEIQSLKEKLDKYKTIKQGMMQELLTGRIQLI